MNTEETRLALLAEAGIIRKRRSQTSDPDERKQLEAKYRQIDYELGELAKTRDAICDRPAQHAAPPPAINAIQYPAQKVKSKAPRKSLSGFLLLVALLILVRVCLGLFVIQPIGAIPDGATVIYWRFNLNIPFIASADGQLEESGSGVSLLGRAVFLGKFADVIKDRKIISLPYSRMLYLYSTGGKEYER